MKVEELHFFFCFCALRRGVSLVGFVHDGLREGAGRGCGSGAGVRGFVWAAGTVFVELVALTVSCSCLVAERKTWRSKAYG